MTQTLRGNPDLSDNQRPDTDQPSAAIASLDVVSSGIAALVDRVGPAVVRVETTRVGRRSGGIGSGVIISPDGLVLTNSHVIHGHHEARLPDTEGHSLESLLIGDAPATDLALLR